MLAKLDVTDYRNQVDNQKRQYQQAVQEVGTAKRDSEQAVEQAKFDLEGKLSSLAIQGKSTSVETEQADLQVGFNKWDLEHAKQESDSRGAPEQGAVGERATGGTGGPDGAFQGVLAHGFAERPGAEEERERDQAVPVHHRHRQTAKFNLELAKRRVTETARGVGGPG